MGDRITNSVRGLWIGLCLCFLAVCFFSESATASGWNHDCRGGDCLACLLARGAESFSRAAKHAEFYSGVSLDILITAAFILGFVVFIPLSSVRLKVRLNR